MIARKVFRALVLAALAAACADARVGPGEITKSAPHAWKLKCATDCRGCASEELEEFTRLKAYCAGGEFVPRESR